MFDYKYYRVVAFPSGVSTYTGESLLPERMSLFAALMYRVLEFLVKENRFYEFSKTLEKGLTEYEETKEESRGENKGELFEAVVNELKGSLGRGVGNEEEKLLEWVNTSKVIREEMVQYSLLLSDIFYGILIKYRKVLKKTKEKIWDEKTVPDFIKSLDLKDSDLDSYIDKKVKSRIDVNADKILCYTLSTLLNAPVTIINIAATTTYGALATAMSSSKAVYLGDSFGEKWLRGKDRSYTLVFESNRWMLCYKDSPFFASRVLLREMVLPLMCRVCGKEVCCLENLFIPEACGYRHKYHSKCLKMKLNELHGKDIALAFINSDEDHGLEKIVCYQCGYKLTNGDMKTIFYDEYKKAFVEQITCEFSKEFPLYEKAQIVDKESTEKLFYSKLLLSNHSPYTRGCFESFTVRKHPKAKNNEAYSQEKLNKILNTSTKVYLQRYCGQCGEFLGAEGDRMALACGHYLCHGCGKEWISFSVGNSQFFADYMNKEVTWPVAKCLHCKQVVDIAGIQIHKDHYVSFPMFVKRCFLDANIACIEGDSQDEANYGPVLKILRDGLRKAEIVEEEKKTVCPLLKYCMLESKIVPSNEKGEENVRLANIWLQHYYAQIRKKDSLGWVLIGYKRLFEDAEKVVNGMKGIKDKFKEIEGTFDKLMAVDHTLGREITGFVESECRKLYCYDTYVHCKIHCEIHRCNFSFDECYYLCLNGATLPQVKAIGSDVTPLLSVAGPFGRGFYVSKDANLIHQMSRPIDDYYYIAQVCLATKMKDAKGEPVQNVINPHRTCGYSQVSTDSKEKKKAPSSRYSGKSIGDMIKVSIDGKEIMVIFEPYLIVPMQLIKYSIDFTKFY